MTTPFAAKYPGYSKFIVVDDPSKASQHDYNHGHYHGWVILDSFPGDVVVTRSEAIGMGDRPNQSYYQGSSQPPTLHGVIEGPKNYVVHTTLFLMGRDEKSEVAALHAQLSDERILGANLREQARVALCAQEEAVEKLAAETKKSDNLTINVEYLRTNSNTFEAQARKYEKDMAVLKRVLGERAILDALNPSNTADENNDSKKDSKKGGR